MSLLTSAATIETCLHAVERIPSAGRGQPAQFVPIRFIYRNKLTKDDKLLLAFDAFVLCKLLGREVRLGKIIHGDDHATLKVKTPALAGEVRKRLGKITALLASPTPPDLVLNRHCAECEFQARCRKLALEKDDLSLLAGMSAKERQKLRSKGIFCDLCTVLFHDVFEWIEGNRRTTRITVLLKPMVETIERHGLKSRFLNKHLVSVARFYRYLLNAPFHSDAALKLKDRFEKNQEKLFTFLKYDGVPWNNNNAECAIKGFATLRRLIHGVTSERGLRDYLVLLSLCETCKYMGVDFLDFLRSGEKDIHAFAESRHRRKRPFDRVSDAHQRH